MRIYKRGKYWWIDFRYKGRRFRYSLKTTSKKLAELYKKQLEIKIFKGEFLGKEDFDDLPFDHLVEVYLNHLRIHSTERTISVREYKLKRLLEEFSGLTLKEITPERIERYKSKRINKVKPATVNQELSILRTMFNLAIKLGYLKENPLRKVQMLKEPPGRVRYLNEDEISRLLEVCPDYLKPIVFTALHTGMRKSEILSLRWDQIDFQNRTITLENTKTNERRVLPINSELYNLLSSLPRKSEYVFVGTDGKPLKNIKRSFKTALRNAKIEDFHFHDLRHTFASHLVMSGVDLRTVQELLGHKTMRMVARYSHLSQKHLREAVEKVGTKWAHKIKTKVFKLPVDTMRKTAKTSL